MSREIIHIERITHAIYLLRGQKVMVDFDLAALYGVATKVLNQVMFQLSVPETSSLRNWSQFVTSSRKHRGQSYRPYAFTEQGVAMLSRSEEHTSELQSHLNLVCRLLLEKKKYNTKRCT